MYSSCSDLRVSSMKTWCSFSFTAERVRGKRGWPLGNGGRAEVDAELLEAVVREDFEAVAVPVE
jgi:hypothetical protein